MKKMLAFFIAALLLTTLIGCNNESTEQSICLEESIPVEKLDYCFSDEIPAKAPNTVRGGRGMLDMIAPIKTDAEKFKISNTVIQGEVIDSNYVLNGSTVFTKSIVLVNRCYKGNIKIGEKIVVKEMGGFVPIDVLDNAISIEKFNKKANKTNDHKLYDVRIENFKVMEKGEKVILFLIHISKTTLEEFCEEDYQLLRMWQGKLLYNEDQAIYAPYSPEGEVSKVDLRCYTLEEFESFIKAQWKA